MWLRIAISAALLYSACALVACSCLLAPPSFDETAWRTRVDDEKVSDLYAPHYRDGRYFNPWMPMEERGFLPLLRWRMSRGAHYTEEEKTYRPAFLPSLKERILSTDGDFIAWIGHNTFLMRVNGEYWMTDPIFSERALLPKRRTPPALTAEEVSALDGPLNVVITHNHYDHFDMASIEALPLQTRFFVPQGLKESIRKLGKEQVIEMDWWQTVECGNGIRLACLPAQHWSMRMLQGRNRTLWASFMLMANGVKIYIGGDSGYFIGYKEFGRVYPGIDYALLPITAYRPRWFMHYAHMNVDEALDAARDLGARYMIPTQWGTFHLGDEPVGYAALELKRKVKTGGLDASRFILMDIGQILPVAPR